MTLSMMHILYDVLQYNARTVKLFEIKQSYIMLKLW